MSSYAQWESRHPIAAAELRLALNATGAVNPLDAVGKSEAWSQQQVRFKAAQAGALAWRNNVGATPARCSECGANQRPIRYGLANDSTRLNTQVKSSDLILAIPRRITPAMVGTTIAQFGSVETKRPQWRYTGTDREVAQAAWLALVNGVGGFGVFSTGELAL